LNQYSRFERECGLGKEAGISDAGESDRSFGESFLALDPAWDGVGMVFSGAFYLVSGDDSRDGAEVDSGRPGDHYAGNGNDADFRRFSGGFRDAKLGGVGGFGTVHYHAFDRVECGDGLRAAGSIQTWNHPGKLLSGRNGVECGDLFGARKSCAERHDDDGFDSAGDWNDAVSDEGLCFGNSGGECLEDGGFDGDDRSAADCGRTGIKFNGRKEVGGDQEGFAASFGRGDYTDRCRSGGGNEAGNFGSLADPASGRFFGACLRVWSWVFLGKDFWAEGKGMPDLFDRGGDAEFRTWFRTGKNSLYSAGGSPVCYLGILPLYDRKLFGEPVEATGGIKRGFRGGIGGLGVFPGDTSELASKVFFQRAARFHMRTSFKFLRRSGE